MRIRVQLPKKWVQLPKKRMRVHADPDPQPCLKKKIHKKSWSGSSLGYDPFINRLNPDSAKYLNLDPDLMNTDPKNCLLLGWGSGSTLFGEAGPALKWKAWSRSRSALKSNFRNFQLNIRPWRAVGAHNEGGEVSAEGWDTSGRSSLHLCKKADLDPHLSEKREPLSDEH